MKRPAKCAVGRCERSRHGGTVLCEEHFFSLDPETRKTIADALARGSIAHTVAVGKAITAAEAIERRNREARARRRSKVGSAKRSGRRRGR